MDVDMDLIQEFVIALWVAACMVGLEEEAFQILCQLCGCESKEGLQGMSWICDADRASMQHLLSS